MVSLGMANSRMKDFFDVWFLCRQFEFAGQTLVDAIRATFERRQTPLPDGPPVALTDAFARDATKQAQWLGFLKRSGVVDHSVSLPDVVKAIAPFLVPALEAVGGRISTPSNWEPGGPWLNR